MADSDRMKQVALFDIITPDVEHGAAAATAEAIAVVESCFRTFPKLREAHEIHVSHSKSRCCFQSLTCASTEYFISCGCCSGTNSERTPFLCDRDADGTKVICRATENDAVEEESPQEYSG